MDTRTFNRSAVGSFRVSPIGGRHGYYRRGKAILPGGKLQPIKKNHSAPSRLSKEITEKDVFNNVDALPAIPLYGQCKLTDERVSNIIRGDLTSLPALPSKVVRLFISSTFADMQDERNILNSKCFPELEDFCNGLGLEFQTVDMRWGVTDNALNDHLTSVLCMSELARCKSVSLGPHFAAILGERYGYRPLPSLVDASQYEVLRDITHNHISKDSSLLMDKWFVKDENAVPPQYLLQPVDTHFKYFNDTSLENAARHSEDATQWWAEFTKLQTAIHKASHLAAVCGKMTEQQGHTFTRSVTEQEIFEGILTCSDPARSAVCYCRQFDKLKDSLEDDNVRLYTDTITDSNGRSLHTEATELMDSLKSKVSSSVPSENFKTYVALWRGNGLDPQNISENNTYLQQFCDDFSADVKRLIRVNLDKQQLAVDKWTDNLKEIVSHGRVASDRSKSFYGRQGILSSVEECVRDGLATVVVHGQSGCGKTSVMAKVSKLCKDWLGKGCVFITRFLGTTPTSSSVQSLLSSICSQIASAWGFNHCFTAGISFRALLREFQSFLQSLSGKYLSNGKRVVIILDAIDQLSSFDDASKMLWLFKSPPANVQYVVSVVSQVKGMDVVDLMEGHLANNTKFVAIGKLDESDVSDILESSLKENGRQLTEDQLRLIRNAFLECSQALFVKLAIDQSLKWKSFESPSQRSLGKSVESAVNLIVDRLEVTYPPLLVKYSLSYMTVVGFQGIMEREVEDLLSCNDQVMIEVYQYHDPPVEGTVHIPSLLWARIHSDIREYITEREKHNRTVISWYHQQFMDTVARRYGLIYPMMENIPRALTEEVAAYVTELHSAFCELYLAVDGVRKTVTLTARNKTIENADRKVAKQPLVPDNHRKLQLLPHHMQMLIPMNGVSDIKEQVLANFSWLCTKLKGLSVGDVYEDYRQTIDITNVLTQEEVLSPREVADISFIYFTLQLAEPSLKVSVDFLAGEIIGRLSHMTDTYPSIANLVASAWEWVKSRDDLIVPTFSCLGPPDGISLSQLRGPHWVIGVVETHDLYVVYNFNPATVQVLEMNSNNVINEFPAPIIDEPTKVFDLIKMSSDGELVFIQSKPKGKTEFTVWNTNSGVKVETQTLDMTVECYAINEETQMALLGTNEGCVVGVSAQTGEHAVYVTGNATESIQNVDIDPDEGIVMATGYSLYIWNESSGELQHTVPVDGCRQGQFKSWREKKFVVLISKGKLLVVNYMTGKTKAHTEDSLLANCMDIKLIRAGFLLVCAVFDQGLVIYQTSNAKRIKHIPVPDTFRSMKRGEFGPNSNVLEIDSREECLFVGFENGLIGVFHVDSGELVRELKHGAEVITSLQYIQGKLYSASNNGSIMNWKVDGLLHGYTTFIDDQEQHVHSLYDLPVKECCLSLDGQLAVTSHGSEQPIKIWATDTGKHVKDLPHSFSGMGATWMKIVAVHRGLLLLVKGELDDDENVMSAQSHEVMMWEVGTWNWLKIAGSSSIKCVDCVLSKPGDVLATVQKSEQGIAVEMYNINEDRKIGHGSLNLEEHWSDTLKINAIGVESSSESVWHFVVQCRDTFGHPPPFFYTFQLIGNSMTALCNKPVIIDDFYHPQPAKLISGGQMVTVSQTSLHFWNITSQEKVKTCQVQPESSDSGIISYQVSGDGDLVVTSDNSCHVTVWNAQSGDVVKKIKVDSLVNAVAFNSDGCQIVTGSDSMIYTWDVQSGMQLKRIYAHSQVLKLHTAQQDNGMIIQAVVSSSDPKMYILS